MMNIATEIMNGQIDMTIDDDILLYIPHSTIPNAWSINECNWKVPAISTLPSYENIRQGPSKMKDMP